MFVAGLWLGAVYKLQTLGCRSSKSQSCPSLGLTLPREALFEMII